jgi:signal transduction histidine kinase
MFVTMLDQAPALLTVRQRRLAVLVISAMLVLFLWLNEIPNPLNSYPFDPLHAAAMGALTLTLIALSFLDQIGHPILRIAAMAAATTGLMVLARTPSQTPIGAYIVILDATQLLRLRTALAITGVLCAAFIATAFRGPAGIEAGWVNVAFNTGFFMFAFVLLYGARRLRDEQFRVRTLLAELEARRARDLAAAKSEERTRLARDIHDVLAHSLTALIVQLDGARMLLTRERASDEAVGSVVRARHLAQEGLDETRRAVGTLRGDRVPGAEMLAGLVDEFRLDSGVDCDYSVDGEPVELASPAQLALYRTAQEALTNVRKHAPSNRVQVHLHYAPDGAQLTVDDFGAGPPPQPNGTVDGYGLEGMRERAELLGGSLEAGPRDTGFRVRLWLPA